MLTNRIVTIGCLGNQKRNRENALQKKIIWTESEGWQDGEIIPDGSWQRGQAVMTSFALEQGKVLGLSLHWKRLQSGSLWLFQKKIGPELFQEASRRMEQESKKSDLLKVQCFLSQRGQKGELFFMMKLSSFKREDCQVELKSRFLQSSFPSSFKMPVYGERLRFGGRDILFTTFEEEILDSVFSNLVLEKKAKFYSPYPQEGLLEGIELNFFSTYCHQIKNPIIRKRIYLRELKEFDSLYLLNSLQSIQSVTKVDKTKFKVGQVKAYQSFRQEMLRGLDD